MNESDQSTIPIRVPQSFEQRAIEDSITRKKGIRAPQPWLILCVALLFVGWGTWRAIEHDFIGDDGASIDELSEFDSDFTSAETLANRSGSPPELGNIDPILAPPSESGTMSALRLSFDSSTTDDEQSSNANVWLTGTIEDQEPKSRTDSPRRISGDPHESSIFR